MGRLAVFRPRGPSLFERALAMREKTLGAAHRDTAWSIHGLGILLRDQGDYASARSLQSK
jgi:Tetratricopeptide repeat